MWMDPAGTNSVGTYPLRGLIHVVDVSRRDLSASRTNPVRTNPVGTYPLRGLVHYVDVSRRDLSHREHSYFFIDFIIK